MWGYFLLDVYCNFKRSLGYEEVPNFEDDMVKIEYISKDLYVYTTTKPKRTTSLRSYSLRLPNGSTVLFTKKNVFV